MSRLWTLGLTAALLTAAAGGRSSGAQEPGKTTTEKIKERVSGAVDSVKKGVVNAEEAIKEQFSRAKSAVVNMGIEARVYSRLHWDKSLAAAKIDLTAPKEGVITLTGTVTDAKAKAKAVELTRDTVGVVQVNDELIVNGATIVEPAKP